MPLFSVVVYIATRLALDGEKVDEGMVKLFARAGLHCDAREVLAEDADETASEGAV
jgi:hypothetical protein